MRFKVFIEEDSPAVIAQMKKVRDQMRVIKLKRDLEKKKEEIEIFSILLAIDLILLIGNIKEIRKVTKSYALTDICYFPL